MRTEYYLVLLALVVLNIWVTIKLARSASFSAKQKLGISIFIWLVPAIGAIAVYLFIKSDDEPGGPNKPTFGGSSNNSIDVALGGTHNPHR